jgi:hypothetical protein
MAHRGDRLSNAFAAVVVAAALAGCAESQAWAERPALATRRVAAAAGPLTNAPSRTPGGYKLRRVADEGLSLAFPRRWTVLDRNDVVFPGAIRTLSRAHRSLTPHLLGLAAADSPLKLLAFHRRAGQAVATTANVFVGPAPPSASLRHQRQMIVRAVRKLDGLRVQVEVSRVRLAAGEALRLESSRRGAATLQYVTIRGERLVALVYTTLPELEARFAPEFEGSARTLSVSG